MSKLLLPIQSRNKTPDQARLPTARGGPSQPFSISIATAIANCKIYGVSRGDAQWLDAAYAFGYIANPFGTKLAAEILFDQLYSTANQQSSNTTTVFNPDGTQTVTGPGEAYNDGLVGALGNPTFGSATATQIITTAPDDTFTFSNPVDMSTPYSAAVTQLNNTIPIAGSGAPVQLNSMGSISGWIASEGVCAGGIGSGKGVTLFTQSCKNLGPKIYYFIVRKRECSGGEAPPNLGDIFEAYDFVSEGFLGTGQSITAPYPTSVPFPPAALGTCPMTSDCYAVILGRSFANWVIGLRNPGP